MGHLHLFEFLPVTKTKFTCGVSPLSRASRRTAARLSGGTSGSSSQRKTPPLFLTTSAYSSAHFCSCAFGHGVFAFSDAFAFAPSTVFLARFFGLFADSEEALSLDESFLCFFLITSGSIKNFPSLR